MKNTIVLFCVLILTASLSFGQDGAKEKAKPTDDDKNAVIPVGSYLKRGAAVGSAKKISLNKVLKDPAKYSGATYRIEGVVVRSCKMEGCWAEVAQDAKSKSVRIKMKDHAFFIPLQSAGAKARVEGTFVIKTLSKAEVDHMIDEDGAKFENRNADGTVTEVSFLATGVELKRNK